MPSYLDLALIAIVLISALLSMVRGFTREVLAIASWAAAFVAAYLFYPQLLPFLGDYIHKPELAIAAAVAIIFFGAIRGFALGVIAFMLFNYLAPKAQPEWVLNAKTRPILQASGEELVAVLPDNLASSIFKVLQKPKGGADEVPPSDETNAADASPNPPAASTTPTPPAKPASGPAQTDKQKLENLLGKGVPPASAKKP